MVTNCHPCTHWDWRMQPNVTGQTSCPYKCSGGTGGGGTGGETGGIGSVSLGWQTRTIRAYPALAAAYIIV